jgi:DNA-binding MarR family transcriptional regulator
VSGAAAPASSRPAGEALTDLVIRTFRLNGLFLAMGELMARPAGLTSARWQVLGAILREPLSVSAIARAMGLTRQSVQRLADALVSDGMAEYLRNPRHRRAKLRRAVATMDRIIARIELEPWEPPATATREATGEQDQ